jgi:hypothetical protein
MNGIKRGSGIFFTCNSKEQGYYYYEGEWKNDIPNGAGKTEEVKVLVNEAGEEYFSKTVTEGHYYNATEKDTMIKYFYADEEETGRVEYSALNGVPMPMIMQSNQAFPDTEGDEYIIGMLYLDDQPTGEYYSVEPETVWGVKPFM